eukprot:6165005-Prymnesium_polylepis.1
MFGSPIWAHPQDQARGRCSGRTQCALEAFALRASSGASSTQLGSRLQAATYLGVAPRASGLRKMKSIESPRSDQLGPYARLDVRLGAH